MPAIIEFPTIVEHAVEQFGAVFANAPERRHFAEYLTGLLVAEKKKVSGLNAEFAQTTAQSCLNRWITEVDWDAAKLNAQRLATFTNHTVWCCELIDWVGARQIPGPFAFDSSFTNAASCNHIAGH